MLLPHVHGAPDPSVTFWGAAQSVTGSMHLVEAGGRKILLDCGLVRDPRHHAHPTGGHFPFQVAKLDAVVLSHAHIDHCGNLPRLVRHGFTGPIFCTPATRDLLVLMLANSARFQEEDSVVHQGVESSGETDRQPGLRHHDARDTMGQCVAIPYGEDHEIAHSIRLRFVNSGHILGSAMVALTVAGNHRTVQITFTGDLGRHRSPLMGNPQAVPACDLLISESTYGSRLLETPAAAAASMEEVVRRTVERGGRVVIPAFSLGRTQAVVQVLQEAMDGGRLPEVPLYVDSPLAADIADVYRRHLTGFTDGKVRYTRSGDESREIAHQEGPNIVIAAGGMCEGGRILQHLKRHIDDPRCSIVLVSYQAPHTPGRRLLERGPTVKFLGRKWNKWADIVYLAGFSGHADRKDLLSLLSPLARETKKVRLVHGEPPEAESLAGALRGLGFADVRIPARGEMVRIE